MDEVRIKSKFTTGIVSKIVRSAVRKKTGYDIDIQLNEFDTTINNGLTHVHLDVDAELSREELMKLLKNFM